MGGFQVTACGQHTGRALSRVAPRAVFPLFSGVLFLSE